jgi:uncharacterized protein (TIGR01244 family)
MIMVLRIVAATAVILLTPSAIPAQQAPAAIESVLGMDIDGAPVEVETFDGEIRGLWRDGRVYIGGQPDESALGFLEEEGVTAVINLRTPEEVDDRERVPFDEASLVRELGMEYVHIPLGGEDHPYTPEAVAVFADVLNRHEGPVFLHCTVGWRASYLWSAYLVRRFGLDLNDALARGKAMAISDLPIEGLLGEALVLTTAD